MPNPETVGGSSIGAQYWERLDKAPSGELYRMQDSTRPIAFSVHGLQLAAAHFDLGQNPARAACASWKARRGRRVVLETSLFFLVLLGSFALVGLLVRFSENVIRPADDMAPPRPSEQ